MSPFLSVVGPLIRAGDAYAGWCGGKAQVDAMRVTATNHGIVERDAFDPFAAFYAMIERMDAGKNIVVERVEFPDMSASLAEMNERVNQAVGARLYFWLGAEAERC